MSKTRGSWSKNEVYDLALLSRAAENLFWIGRYVERAENIARLLDTGKRMSAIPGQRKHQPEWEPILSAAGVRPQFDQIYDVVNQQNVVHFLALSFDNPSSIISCVAAARNNARAVRTAMTFEMWEALNSFWLELKQHAKMRPGDGQLSPFLDQVKRCCALFVGVTSATILHNDTFNFLRLGHHIERADCTARILDVKYFALLAPSEEVAGSVDLFQWSVLLRATGSFRAYHWVYGGDFEPRHIADFLILNADCARSLAHCMREINDHLNRLARLYAAHHHCHELSNNLNQDVSDGDIDTIFAGGLHEFLTDFMRRNNELSNQIARDYYFTNRPQPAPPSQSQSQSSIFGSQTQTTA